MIREKWIVILVVLLTQFGALTLNAQNSKRRKAIYFKGQQRSLIEWEKSSEKWLDLEVWKAENANRENNPDWEVLAKNRLLRENMGRVIQCIGECLLHRGLKFNNADYRSGIKEGDELTTGDDSFIWVFLLDGTLVRLSPNSSISFKEINIGIDDIFLHARMNYGNILWLTRDPRMVKESNLRETDTLFLPLSMLDANTTSEKVNYTEANLYSALTVSERDLLHSKRLNKLINENNLIIDYKPTYSFLIMPNGSVFGANLQMEFVVLDGGPSFIKKRDPSQLRLKVGEIAEEDSELSAPSLFYYRGFQNKQVDLLESGFWYMATKDGTGLGKSKVKNGPEYAMGEFITHRVTSLLMARELMLRKYSTFIFEDTIDSLEFAQKHGFRLWGKLVSKPLEDMGKRIEFLIEFSRRVETTNLIEREKYKTRLRQRGLKVTEMAFSREFYKKALNHYYLNERGLEKLRSDREILNSTKNPLWKKLQNKR